MIGQKQQNSFLQTRAENFLVSIKQSGEQVGLLFSFLNDLDTFQSFRLFILVEYPILFILGKCLVDS